LDATRLVSTRIAKARVIKNRVVTTRFAWTRFASTQGGSDAMAVILIRRLLGDVLRRKRQDEGRTLRQLAAEARISPGYLSEIERGQKEPSSELLAAICHALDVRLSDLLREVSVDLAAAELAVAIEAERLRVGAVPAARVGAGAAKSAQGAVKSAPLAKPVSRTAPRPGARPAARPVTRRVPPAAGSPTLLAPYPAEAALGPVGPLAVVERFGPVTAIGSSAESDRVMTFPLVSRGDLALR